MRLQGCSALCYPPAASVVLAHGSAQGGSFVSRWRQVVSIALAAGLVVGVMVSAGQASPEDGEAPAGVPGASSALVIRGAHVITVAGEEHAPGTVVVLDGKIAAVGPVDSVEIPAGAQVIEAAGSYLMPGIVDTHSHMGVYSWPSVKANWDGNEMTSPITPQVRAEDALNLHDPAFQRARAGGVTTVQVIPGSGNMIGGQGVVIKLRPVDTLAAMRLAGAPRQMKMASGENPKRVYGERKKLPSTRMGNFLVMREAFAKARDYMDSWERWEAKTDKDDASPPDRDLKLEALADVMRGRIRVHIHCYRADEILTLMGIADEFGWKIASLQHCLEGYKVAEHIARAGIGVATFSDWWGYKVEAWDAIPQSPAILAAHGVRVSIHSDSPDLIQRLFHEAAKSVKHGLPYEEGLKAITLHPAWMLGIDDRVGSIEVGKDADLALFSRHPFDIYTLVQRTWIDGRLVFHRSADAGRR